MPYTNETFEHKTILITGGAGFIGSNLAFYFQENHPKAKVIVFDTFRNEDRFSNGNLKSFGHFKNLLGFRGEIIQGDINNSKDLEKLKPYSIDIIFHQAAISDTTVLDQGIMMQTNVNAFKDLLNIALEKNAKVVYASSAATYGNSPSPQRIGHEAPENVYGFSKLAMDNLALDFAQKSGLTIIGLRYFNVYGPREYYKNKTASMVVQLGHQILSGKAPRLFYDSDKIVRDFIYIEDVIKANILALKGKRSAVYNVGTSKPRSFQDIADILQKELGTNLGTDYFQNPLSAYQAHTQADISLTSRELGFSPDFTLEKGIKAYIPEIKRLFEVECAK
ncbi:MAG: ADP-glyceromanno-heptose 6-epimerase [Campylobacteraceae bacterium]|nr:ADP-glyceromanno-heptose 6-epimerase [Campylobacteraceae bacterium]